jgi:hypothetical protein
MKKEALSKSLVVRGMRAGLCLFFTRISNNRTITSNKPNKNARNARNARIFSLGGLSEL